MSKRNNGLFKRTAEPEVYEEDIYTDPDTGDVIEGSGITDAMLSDLPPGYSLEEPLSAKEKKRLAELETFISDNLKTFYDVGCALREICERRLYRETHTTFADYIKDTCDLARSRAYQMIDSADVVDRIKQIEFENVHNCGQNKIIPQNECQARVLVKYKDDLDTLRDIWEKSIESAGDKPITASHIRKTINSIGVEKVKKAVKKARKPSGKKSPKMSQSFEEAYFGFLDAINVERESDWKNTDPKPAIQAIRVILQALEAEL